MMCHSLKELRLELGFHHSSWSCTSVFAHRMSTIRCALFREMSKNRCAAFQRCAEFEWGVRGAKPPGKFFSNFAQNIAILMFFFNVHPFFFLVFHSPQSKMDETKWMRRKKRMSKNRCAQKLEMSKTGMSAFFTADEHDFRQMCNSNYFELSNFSIPTKIFLTLE